MSDLWEHDPSEAWGDPPDDDCWKCDCAAYNPDENTHCFNCGKPKPEAKKAAGVML